MSVGVGTYGNVKVTVAPGFNGETFSAGAYCSFSDGVEVLLGGEHHAEWVTTYPFRAFAEWSTTPAEAELMARGRADGRRDVTIGNDVWVGVQALFLSGARVGDGAIVAARSVVSGEVAPYAVVAGNPARFVRWRFPEHVRAALQEIRWWDWPRERISKALPVMLSGEVERFIRLVNQGEL